MIKNHTFFTLEQKLSYGRYSIKWAWWTYSIEIEPMRRLESTCELKHRKARGTTGSFLLINERNLVEEQLLMKVFTKKIYFEKKFLLLERKGFSKKTCWFFSTNSNTRRIILLQGYPKILVKIQTELTGLLNFYSDPIQTFDYSENFW